MKIQKEIRNNGLYINTGDFDSFIEAWINKNVMTKYPNQKIFLLTEEGIQLDQNYNNKTTIKQVKFTVYDIILFTLNKKSKLDFIENSLANSICIWNFNITLKPDNMRLDDVILKFLYKLKSIKATKNLIIINSNSLNYEEFKKISKGFDKIYIIDKGREFQVASQEFDKMLWLISGNPEIRCIEEVVKKSSFMIREMNTQLTQLHSCLLLINARKTKDQIVEKQIQLVKNSIKNSINLSENFKYYIKNMKKGMELAELSLDDEVFEAYLLIKEKLHCKVNIKTEARVDVFCNKAELREVLINVIKNAYEAINIETGEISITTLADETRAYIKIEDNGVGISREVISKVFEPFYSSKHIKGTGVGLTISKEIISRHKGDITVNSWVGKGTKIKITLPIYKYSSNELNSRYANEDKKILVIDAKRSVREDLAELLTNEYGAQVHVSDGRYYEEMTNRVKYDIIICDMNISEINIEGVNGGEVASRVKAKNKGVYFILMIGSKLGLDINKINDVDSVITKPVTKEKLKEVLSDCEKRDFIIC